MENLLLSGTLLHWLAVLFYAMGIVANAWGIIFLKKEKERISHFLMLTGLLIHGVGLLLRWLASGHGPYIVKHEVLSSYAWVNLALFYVFYRLFPKIQCASIVIFPTIFLTIGLSLFQDPGITKLPPALKSTWLVLHVIFYKISLGTILTALTFSLFYILKKRTSLLWLRRLPDLVVLDMYAYRFTGFGFIFWTIATLAGSIWAFDSWGRFWAWDPIETWSFITWLTFGIYLHLRRFFGLKGEKAAGLLLICFFLSLTALFFVPLLDTTLHSEYFR